MLLSGAIHPRRHLSREVDVARWRRPSERSLIQHRSTSIAPVQPAAAPRFLYPLAVPIVDIRLPAHRARPALRIVRPGIALVVRRGVPGGVVVQARYPIRNTHRDRQTLPTRRPGNLVLLRQIAPGIVPIGVTRLRALLKLLQPVQLVVAERLRPPVIEVVHNLLHVPIVAARRPETIRQTEQRCRSGARR